METLSYWLSRLEPLIRAEGEEEIIVVLANRSGTEGEAVYAGTSTVLGIQDGEVKVYGILGRGERELLVVDTKKRPAAQLISEPRQKQVDQDVRSSMSSGTTVESDQSIRDSISTAPTSANPADTVSPQIESCCFPPTSPVEAPLPQTYFETGAPRATYQYSPRASSFPIS
jgi:protein N-terminal amidase